MPVSTLHQYSTSKPLSTTSRSRKNNMNAMLMFQKNQHKTTKDMMMNPEVDVSYSNKKTSSATTRYARRRARSQYNSPSTCTTVKATKSKQQQKRVTFKCDAKPQEIVSYQNDLMSYDELVYTVAIFNAKERVSAAAGMDEVPFVMGQDEYLNDPDYEHSLNLIVAEFLHRSAIFLGYSLEAKSWYPSLRETDFTSNDVKRWRRLARHNWEKEEEARNPNAAKIKYAISGWINQRSIVLKSKEIWSRRHSDPVPMKKDLSLFVEIINSCIFYGAFQFTQNDILRLCNVQI